jgi:hypothetical protein
MATSTPSRFSLERTPGPKPVTAAKASPNCCLLSVSGSEDFALNLAHLEKREGRQYSLVKAIAGMVANGRPGAVLETEVSLELSAISNRSVDSDTILFPLSALATRDLDSSDSSSLIATRVTEEVTPFMRARAVTGRLGATLLDLPPGNVSIPRITSTANATWSAETGPITVNAPTFDNVLLVPSLISTITLVSRQLLVQATPSVSKLVISDISQSIANEVDRVVLNGTGVSPQPLGILNMTPNTAGQYKYNLRSPDVTFGAAADWAHVVQFESTIDGGAQVHNIDNTYGWCGAPDVRQKWMGVQKALNYPSYLWEQPNGEMDGRVAGRLAISTSQLPVGRIIFGRWSDVLIGTWGSASAQINPYSFASKGQVEIRVSLLVAVGFRYSSAFITSSDSASQ